MAKRRCFFLILFMCCSVFAQTPSIVRNIRFPVWAELDAYPELKEAQDVSLPVFDYPVSRIRKTAPFLIAGMVYGWSFTYTPSDKLRAVQEYFEFEPLTASTAELSAITYSDPWIEDNKLNCWVSFTRTEQMVTEYNLWSSITHPVISGTGTGRIEDGFDGIINAAKDALKEAVRAYFRSVVHNKPKEITGKVLIRRQPEIGISSGRYLVKLDFFLETDRIIPYTQY